MRVVIVSYYGKVNSPSLWSGTPKNIRDHLTKISNLEIEELFVLRSQFVHRLLMGLEIIFNFWPKRSILRTLISSFMILFYIFMKDQKEAIFLHLEPVGYIPRRLSKRRKIQHYLFLDSTVIQWFDVSESGVRASKKSKSIQIWKENRIFTIFEGFFPISKKAYNSLIEDYEVEPSKIKLIRTGCGIKVTDAPLIHDSEAVDEDTIRVLTIAKVEHWRKGVDLILQAAQESHAANIHFDLVLGKKYLSSAIANVTFHNFLPSAQLSNLYFNSDVFVLPCRFEPYGLVFLEAVRANLPIVATVESGLVVDLYDMGWPVIFAEQNSLSVIQSILRSNSVLTKVKELDKVRDNILARFDWEKMSQEMVAEWKL